MDKINLEKQEINKLLDNGIEFEVDGKKYLIKQPTLGVLHLLSSVFVEMTIDEEKLKNDPIAASRRMVLESAELCAKAVAIAVLGIRCVRSYGHPNFFVVKQTRYKLIKRWTNFFLLHLTPESLANFMLIINQMGNYGDFINSIRWMSGARVTAPSRVEEDVQG